MKMIRIVLVALAGLLCAAGCDRNSPEKRARALLEQMTLEEKASLMMHESPAIPRLGIRGYTWWNEALHGVARNGSATTFPQPIGMAASFDEALVLEVFDAVSDEARIKHLEAEESKIYQGLTFWTPNINIFRDPRWGRGMETYGEDPYLTGVLGSAVVRGLQGDPEADVLKAHACAKHFAVHSGLESTRHTLDVDVSDRDLRETYLPAFKELVTRAGVKEVMTAYNRFRGKPCAASDLLVNDILRGEWGYRGMVVSDCWAVPDFYEKGHHEVVDNAVLAAALAAATGVDVECGSTYVNLPEAVTSGLLDESVLGAHVLRLLTERFRLGEMDGASPWDDLDPALVEGPEHRALSLKMARESLVLLQNRSSVLPLSAGQRIAVVGPNADDAELMWGNYNPIPKSTVTLLDALRERVPGIKAVRGCGVIDAAYQPAWTRNERTAPMLDSFLPVLDERAVLAELEDVDIVIFAGGISPRFEGEEMRVEVPGFFGGDRTDIELPEVQRRLLKALHEAGKKVVLVNFSGSAVGLVPETETCDAILQAWYPGQEGGTAIAEVLFGDVNPSGKLPVTFYRSVDDLPEVENYDMEGHTYRYFRGEPLFAFGYGLSYSDFSIGEARVEKARTRLSNGLVAKKRLVVPVTNRSATDGVEVVQLYVRKPDDPDGPIKTLRGFCRVSVPAGRTVDAVIPLTDETFLWWDEAAGDMVPVRGDYELLYGNGSDAACLKTIGYAF